MYAYVHAYKHEYIYVRVCVIIAPYLCLLSWNKFLFSDIPLKGQRMSVTSYLILCKLISYSTTNIPQYFVILNPTLGEINDLQSWGRFYGLSRNMQGSASGKNSESKKKTKNRWFRINISFPLVNVDEICLVAFCVMKREVVRPREQLVECGLA